MFNPREDDNLGTMICFHNRYSLGDKHEMKIEDAIKLERSDDVVSLELYLYDHSGITIATTSFSCPWDSGKVGFIYVTKERIRQEYGGKRVGKGTVKLVREVLEAEVREYDKYITGGE